MNDYAGFDIVANRILEVVDEYIYGKKVIENGKEKRVGGVECHFDDDLDDTEDNINKYVNGGICYWVTGHSMGGAVANLVSASIISSSAIPELQNLQGTSDNVYCYTFAAPNTFYSPDNKFEERITYERNYKGEWREPKGNKYRCIFNIVNDDDFVTKVPMEKCNWTKYGRTATQSFNEKVKSKKEAAFVNYYYSHYTTDYNSEVNHFSYIIYDGSRENSNVVSDALSDIFENNSNMRREAYTFDDECLITNFIADEDMSDANRNRYVKPYQKNHTVGIDGTEFRIKQYQMPAYFMHVIAGAMHTSNNTGITINPFSTLFNKASIIATPLSEKYKVAQGKIVENNSKITIPHYLESYYVLTKNVAIKDFR